MKQVADCGGDIVERPRDVRTARRHNWHGDKIYSTATMAIKDYDLDNTVMVKELRHSCCQQWRPYTNYPILYSEPIEQRRTARAATQHEDPPFHTVLQADLIIRKRLDNQQELTSIMLPTTGTKL